MMASLGASHLEILVEEASAEAMLRALLPKILPAETTFDIHSYHGKRDLLSKLEQRLRGYRPWLPPDWRIVVLVDEDRQDCSRLKSLMEACARRAGFRTKSSPNGTGDFRVVNRLAIEELEAWFFGDINALVRAYPRVPKNLAAKAKYRDPDAIAGGTWESLERVLKRAGYYRSGMPKVEVAQRVAQHMCPDRNRSHSFSVFCDGVLSMFT